MLTVLTGLLAGSQHVVSGADHMAAVAPLAVHVPRRAMHCGLRWGLGHALGIALLGSLALAFREALPLARVAAYSELLIGALLIGLGVRGLRAAHALRHHVASHSHALPPRAADGAGGHPIRSVTGRPEPLASRADEHAALGAGTLHGFAGTSHLVGVLAALAFESRLDAATYIVGFAAGNILAMLGFSPALGWLATRVGVLGRLSHGAFLAVLSSLTVGVGVLWLGLALAGG